MGAITTPEHVKVFILYLLYKIGYPISYNDLATVVIRDGYVDYFDFVTNFHELLDRDLIRCAPDDGESSADQKPVDREFYSVTENGKIIAREYSEDVLLASVREKSYISAQRYMSLEKRGAVLNHNIEKTADGYVFRCSVKDRDGLAFELALRAESFEQVSKMLSTFEDRPELINRGLLSVMTGEINYLVEKH